MAHSSNIFLQFLFFQSMHTAQAHMWLHQNRDIATHYINIKKAHTKRRKKMVLSERRIIIAARKTTYIKWFRCKHKSRYVCCSVLFTSAMCECNSFIFIRFIIFHIYIHSFGFYVLLLICLFFSVFTFDYCFEFGHIIGHLYASTNTDTHINAD